MPRSTNTQASSPISLRCRGCGQRFNGTQQRYSVVCKPLRQHIFARNSCLEEYDSEGLIGRRRTINLTTSIETPSSRTSLSDSHSSGDNMSFGSFGSNKRPAPTPPHNEPLPKRVHLANLRKGVLEMSFGALPQSNMLSKGQKFCSKNTFRATAQWKAPTTKELDQLFFHGNEFFSNFSADAMLHAPKAEELAPPIGQVVDLTNSGDDSDSLSADESDDESSVDSEDDADGGSVRYLGESDGEDDSLDASSQRTGGNGHPTVTDARVGPGDPPIANPSIARNAGHPENPNEPQTFRLLERYEDQCKATTIRPDLPLDHEIVADLQLLQIQHKYSIPLTGIEAIRKWAHESFTNFGYIFQRKPPTRKKQLKNIRKAMGIKKADAFREVAIDWLPENKKRPIHVRSFEDCLYELLSNQELVGANGENISLPHPSNPFESSPEERPHHSSQLHHGLWWTETMDECCKKEGEILVPIIGYMDGVSTDNNGRLPITPFNITLGIFNTETRRKAEAWTTMLLYPDDNSEASLQKGTKPFHKIQNLHNTLAVAFTDLRELMQSGRSVPWKIPYGPSGALWEVRLKFAFCYVIGDTEMHDKLCGRYGPRTRGIKCICRHCNCPTNQLAKGGKIFEGHIMFTPEILDASKHDAAHFKSLSHHPITNAFHSLYFGVNKFNIHLASPGELLHMVQKGACIRVVEGLVNMWKDPSVQQDNVTAVTDNWKSNVYLQDMDKLGKIYGAHLSRQSDRDRPRTKFRTSLFKKCKKNGHEHAGVLLCILCALLSDRGRQILAQRTVDERWTENHVYLFELLLQFEQFMKMTEIPIEYTLDERHLGYAMDHLLKTIDGTVTRSSKSMGNNTSKNHLLQHLPHYASRWGPMTAMDSGDSERNHKTQVKPQSKMTQRKEDSFQSQFGKRWCETRLVSTAIGRYQRVHGALGGVKVDEPVEGEVVLLDGTHFEIGISGDDATFGWSDPSNRGRATHPQAVIDFICHQVLHKVADNTIRGRTEAKVLIGGERFIFRAHPNYRSESNQRTHVWYDWAMFEYKTPRRDPEVRPGQIVAILNIGRLHNEEKSQRVGRRLLYPNRPYAVVRLFTREPKLKFRKSTLHHSQYTYSVKWGRLMDGFMVLPVDSIVGTAIVVPNIPEDPVQKVKCPHPLKGGYFVIPGRTDLGLDFLDVIRRESRVGDGSEQGEDSTEEESEESEEEEEEEEEEDGDGSSGSEDESDSDTSDDSDDYTNSGSPLTGWTGLEYNKRVDHLTKYMNKINF